MNNQELAKIVKQVQNNKKKYFENLFSEIYKTIYYLSYKFLNNAAEAEDVSQDIVLYIYNHIDELKTPEGFNKWMNRIIYNKCKDHVRKLSNRREDDFQEKEGIKEEIGLQNSPEKVIQKKEKNQFVLEIIEDLPTKQKEVVLLYYYQQLTAQEIATVLACSLPSIQNRLHKAKKSIRDRVENSSIYTTQQLFGLGMAPLLYKFFIGEVNKIATKQIGKIMWAKFMARPNIVKETQIVKEKGLIENNKTNLILFCYSLIMTILLITIITLAAPVFNKEESNVVVTKAEKQTQSILQLENLPQVLEDITESIMILEVETKLEPNAIHNQERKNNEMVKVNESDTQIETREEIKEDVKWNLYKSEFSQDEKIVIWKSEEEIGFANKAVVQDKDMEELVYTYNAGDKVANELVYGDGQYKIDSGTVYHTAAMPIISLQKLGSLLEDNRITYEIMLENIGKVPAYNIMVKDQIPEYTKFIEMIESQSAFNIKISSSYVKDIDTIFWTIDKLEPQEKIMLAFQVQVRNDYEAEREIKNIAYLKVMGKNSDDLELRLEEQGYIESNAIIYVMQELKEINPPTGDMIRLEIYCVLLFMSLGILGCYVVIKKKRGKVI